MWGPKIVAVLALLPYQGLAAPGHPAVDISAHEMYGEPNSVDATPNSLDKRGRPVWKNIVCGPGPYGLRHAGVIEANQVANQMRNWKGFPRVGARSCKVLYSNASDTVEIWLCNDNAYELRLPGYADVADATRRIIDECGDQNTLVPQGARGQQFAEGNWNVILRAFKFR